MSRVPPTAVLSDALAEAIAGRRVRCAVFTTYSFDPGFFEENVLPLLFDRPFSQVPKVRAIQLEDALRTIDAVSVYYDRSALAQDASAARLDVRRIDVRRATGVFHPKVVLLLLDESMEQDTDELEEEVRLQDAESGVRQSLVIGVLSANLTPSGWWDSVEAFHFEELHDKDVDSRRCSFRPDLLTLMLQIRRSAAPDEEHAALDRIHEFLLNRVSTDPIVNVSSKAGYYTRLFCGQSRLADWFASFGFPRETWNLEIVSPFFDGEDEGTLTTLLEAIRPRDTRVHLPTDASGAALVTPTTYAAVKMLAKWASLPPAVTRRSKGRSGAEASHRGVHAKVYRLWSASGQEVVLVGSPNLTRAGNARYGQGNLEAAFFVDVSDIGRPQGWWLEPIEKEVTAFSERPAAEDEASGAAIVDISFRFDWARRTLAYFAHREFAHAVKVLARSGEPLFEIKAPAVSAWTDIAPTDAVKVEKLLASTSFLEVVAGDITWRVLVREEQMAYRPSLLRSLTPEEILLYWSLLSPAQREAFLAEKLQAEAELEGLPSGGASRQYTSENTVFDRFAGRFHAFECMRRNARTAITSGRSKEAESRLFGEQYDSLPALLDKIGESPTDDPVLVYVTFLCARQVVDGLRDDHPEFWSSHADGARRLEERLARLDSVRRQVPLDRADAERGLLVWYEETFLRRAEPPPDDEEGAS